MRRSDTETVHRAALAMLGGLVVVLLAGHASRPAAQEIPYDLKGCGTSDVTVVDKLGDTVVGQTVTRGLTSSIPPGGPFDRMSYECRNVWHSAQPGLVEFSNRCIFVDAQGDKLLGTSTGTSKGYQWRFLAGSGKWEGITGGGPGEPSDQYPRLSPTTTAGCWRGKGTYTIRK